MFANLALLLAAGAVGFGAGWLLEHAAYHDWDRGYERRTDAEER